MNVKKVSLSDKEGVVAVVEAGTMKIPEMEEEEVEVQHDHNLPSSYCTLHNLIC